MQTHACRYFTAWQVGSSQMKAAQTGLRGAGGARSCEAYNFSGITFDYEAQGSYRTYARLLAAVSATLHAAVPRREVRRLWLE